MKTHQSSCGLKNHKSESRIPKPIPHTQIICTCRIFKVAQNHSPSIATANGVRKTHHSKKDAGTESSVLIVRGGKSADVLAPITTQSLLKVQVHSEFYADAASRSKSTGSVRRGHLRDVPLQQAVNVDARRGAATCARAHQLALLRVSVAVRFQADVAVSSLSLILTSTRAKRRKLGRDTQIKHKPQDANRGRRGGAARRFH